MVCEEDKAEGELFTVERKRRSFIVWFGDKLIFSNPVLAFRLQNPPSSFCPRYPFARFFLSSLNISIYRWKLSSLSLSHSVAIANMGSETPADSSWTPQSGQYNPPSIICSPQLTKS